MLNVARRFVSSRRHLGLYPLPQLRRMSDLTQAGQVRVAPDSEVEIPQNKKARLEVQAADTQHNLAKGAAVKVSQTKSKESKKSKPKSKRKKLVLPEACSSEDVLWQEIKLVLGADVVEKAIDDGVEFNSPFEFHEEVEVIVMSLSPTGDAVAIPTSDEQRRTPWAIVVPFALPKEIIRVRVYQNARMHSIADLVEIVSPNLDLRDDALVKCRYFTKCGGCQYQMLSYESQLSLKRDVIIKAYENYSGLPASSVPTVLPTIGSPLQYGYRTKLTPHFEAAPKSLLKKQQDNTGEDEVKQPDWLKIGFNIAGSKKMMDIEECPIATPVINEALPAERARIIKTAYTFKRGASLILRDSLDPSIPLPPETLSHPSDSESIDVDKLLSEALNKHVCVTTHKSMIRENVGGFIFEYPASSFFQNNNSVLVPLTEYVREAIFPSDSDRPPPTHLVDTYCGSGLFAITLSPYFKTISGIELSKDSIRSAQRNVSLNNSLRSIPSFNNLISSTGPPSTPSTSGSKQQPDITFLSGTASDIFSSVSTYPYQDTAIIIDPPRKGCDEEFIRQVVRFRPAVLVYVSCNVHTQARDVGMLIRMVNEAEEKCDATERKGVYQLESLRGFDLFPQTAHVESVAILRLK